MPDAHDNVAEQPWFKVPDNVAAASAAPPAADAAAPGPAAFAGERFGYHASNWLEAADEAFPVAPQVFQLYGDVVGKIDQGIADGSINGDDKEKFVELNDKYSAIWDDYAKSSGEATRQDEIDILERTNDDLNELGQRHPDFNQQVQSQAPSTDAMVDTVDLFSDLNERGLERADHFTTGFLDGAQIILDYTREAAEIRSHQDGADADAMHDALQRADNLQTDLDDAYEAAGQHLDQKLDAVEKWRDQSEQYLKDHPNPTQTSEGFDDQPKVTVNIASPDAAGRLIHEAQPDVATAYAAADDAGHEGPAGVAVAVAVAEPHADGDAHVVAAATDDADHVAMHDSGGDTHLADVALTADAS